MQLAALVSSHLSAAMNRTLSTRGHRTVVIVDHDLLPAALLEGIARTAGTEVELLRVAPGEDLAARLAKLHNDGFYLSIMELVLGVIPRELGSGRFLTTAASAFDFTAFELPRFGLTRERLELLLARHFAMDPLALAAHFDRFFSLLERELPWRVRVSTGARQEHVLVIEDDGAWVEVGGPYQDADVRFAPAAELFYGGRRATGRFSCLGGGLNLLPLRSPTPQRETERQCEQLLALARRLATEEVIFTVERGRIVAVESPRSRIGRELGALFATDPNFSDLLEVGIGLNPAARPLVHDWAATTNESATGVHIGIGADPADSHYAGTDLHLDFISLDATVEVCGEPFMIRGRPVASSAKEHAG